MLSKNILLHCMIATVDTWPILTQTERRDQESQESRLNTIRSIPIAAAVQMTDPKFAVSRIPSSANTQHGSLSSFFSK